MRKDKFDMGEKHKRELKKKTEEITKLKLDVSEAKIRRSK